MSRETVHILWTGGWDSTYRLLDLLSRTTYDVQPHYILDPIRTSSANEISTMEKLREIIGKKSPEWEHRIKPLRVMNLDQIPEDPAIDSALDTLRSEGHLGKQYAWLARYVKVSGVERIDLCVEATDAAGKIVSDLVRQSSDFESPNYYLPFREDAAYSLFKWFYFPLIWTDKKKMETEVDALATWNVMKQTWFCHQPVLERFSCGTCRPCVYVMNKGQSWRMSFVGRSRFFLIEKSKRILPVRFKLVLRNILGNRVKRFVRS